MSQPNTGGPGIETGERDRLLFEIVDEIAAAIGTEPFDMPPLGRYVNVDAILRLITSATPTYPDQLTISFKVEEAIVSVFGDGTVEVSSVGTTSGAAAGAADA